MEAVVWIVLLGLLFDYTNGFHDAANVVATPIATKALKVSSAIFIASIFNFVGATQISGVAETIATGLVEAHEVTQLMVIAAVSGAIVWNLITWYFGIPSSSSYALIGGLVGVSIYRGGWETILWKNLTYKVLIPMAVSPILGFLIACGGMRFLLKFTKRDRPFYRHFQIGSTAMVALAHGLNDAQKSMGIITLGLFSAGVISSTAIPLWVIFACASVMALGTASGGFRIIRTIGFGITELKPMNGFVAELSSSSVMLVASFLAMPLSSTHVMAGTITGVGAAKGAAAVRWTTAHKMVLAWVLTLPGAAICAWGVFLIFK